ncbi:metalloregulator ArsR/SmtB family transcription factor [Deinococcus sp. HMF7620]|uniref:Metalloregulator ArsR/SmtB family transcription factor n=1 Tax=Deinococcus arboris TaxID=2682977 RepID=A0A7C9MBB6_9DEIO|nr:metalloregulator ArsR/SmtB family transcription factor [Deinococcus arboris]MVN88919.1 metalloregulator ArsR/SmtB family transcription factor [Deinococcus arboris]
MRTASQDDVCEVPCLHPEAVQLARTQQPEERCIENAASFLKLMADPTRLKILSALQTTELCVCDLAAVVGISESAVSHQLRLLRTGRIVTFRKDGRVAYYRLLDHHVTTTIRNALDHARE